MGFRSVLRSFAVLAGDFSLDDMWALGSIRVIVVWIFYISGGVIILLNVLIAVVTESYDRTQERRHSILGIARIPILAKHSYLDTEARKLSERGIGDYRYQIALIGILTCFILFAFSFAAVVRTIQLDIVVHNSTAMFMDKVKLALISVTYVVANVAMVTTINDLFHIGFQWNCVGSHYVVWIVKPFVKLVFLLLGVGDKDEYCYNSGEDLDEMDVLSRMKDMIDLSTNVVRADIHKLATKLKNFSSSEHNGTLNNSMSGND